MSMQRTIERRRKERVHIRYDVEDLGMVKQVELPYIVGVLADLSGDPVKPLPLLRDREFIEIDQKGFDRVLQGAAPHVAYSVPNRLTAEANTKLAVDLHFKSFDDFAPDRIAEQVPALKALLEKRRQLKELLNRMPGKPNFRELLDSVLSSTEKRMALASELGITPTTTTTTPADSTEAPK